jgi:ribosome maturation factor RimP
LFDGTLTVGGEMGAEEQIAEALRPTVQAEGLEIWDVERSGTSLRVLVERSGGVDLGTISKVSGAISAVLDARDELVPAGHYTLEVSSPGLERRLRRPGHFAAFVGHEVAVKTAQAVDGSRRFKGALVGAGDDAITLRLAEGPGAPREITVPLEQVQRANAVFNWGPSAAPGAQRARGGRAAAPAGAHRSPAPGPEGAEGPEEVR